MANITNEQIKKANAKLYNGFKLDVGYYLTHSEKAAVKAVEISDNIIARLHIMYMPEYKDMGGWRVQTGRQIPTCHITKEIKEGDFYHSYGLGKWVKIGEPQDKKIFSVLQKVTANIDVDMMVQLAAGEPNTLSESKNLF